MSFRSVSEVAMAKPTEKAIGLKETNELYITEPDGKTRPVSWADIYEEIIKRTKSKEPKTGIQDNFEGICAGKLREALVSLKMHYLLCLTSSRPTARSFTLKT